MILSDPMNQHDESLADEFREAFRRAGLRATRARLLVARYLVRTPGMVTVNDVVTGVDDEQLDRVTVFRTLRSFEQVGFVVVRKLRDHELRFEMQQSLLVQQEGVSQFFCSKCGKFFALPVNSFSVKLGAKAKLVVAELSDVLLRGVCNKCQRGGKR
jgi:Fur family ferric uptake transcriptional regulator